MVSLPSHFKMGKCLEWCTHLPLQDRPQMSPVFLIQNKECYFYFCRSKRIFSENSSFHYEVYLKTKDISNQLKSLNFTIYVNYDGDSFGNSFYSNQAMFLSTDMYVFSFSDSLFSNKLVNLSSGLIVKYFFVFDYKDGFLLLSDTKTEEKCVQTGSYLSGNVCLESLSDDLSKLLETELNHDLEIKCGEHSLKAHKSVLCARSEVFKTMMQNEFEGRTGVVHVQDMASCYFRDFVQYLYTGSMRELTFDKAKTLYEIGDKYAVRSLMLRCSEYLQDNLSEENIYKCFLLADAHSDEKLKDKIKTYIIEKSLYLEDEYWAPFCEEFPKFSNDLYRQLFKRHKIQKE